LDGSGFEYWWERDFPRPSKAALVPTLPRGADHPPKPTLKLKKEKSSTFFPLPPLYLYCMLYGELFCTQNMDMPSNYVRNVVFESAIKIFGREDHLRLYMTE
jgi:hypothetical protein